MQGKEAEPEGRWQNESFTWQYQPATAALQLFFHCSVRELFCSSGSTGLSHNTRKRWSSNLEAAWHTWIFSGIVNKIAMQFWNVTVQCSLLSRSSNGFRKTHWYVPGLVQDPSPLSTRFWHHFSFLEEAANLVTTLRSNKTTGFKDEILHITF